MLVPLPGTADLSQAVIHSDVPSCAGSNGHVTMCHLTCLIGQGAGAGNTIRALGSSQNLLKTQDLSLCHIVTV